MVKNEHPLHQKTPAFLKKLIKNNGKEKWVFDPACQDDNANKMHISLFNDKVDSSHRLCKVDGVLITETDSGNKEVKVIVEVDESNNKPTHILGKFFTSVFSNIVTYDKGKTRAVLSSNITFIQIVKVSENEKSKKINQLQQIKQFIDKFIKNSNFGEYKLYYYKESVDKIIKIES